uniref:phosphatase domain-containing protein n=1 Tax=Alistipes sp. TaxID=1872444 RepID=UPI004055D11F
MEKDIIICDIDGTISQVGERLRFLQQDPKDWDSFYNDCFDDEPIPEMVILVTKLCQVGYRIIFCTGRRESVREQTERWIRKHTGNLLLYPRILMRSNGDHRHDTIVKPELLKLLTPDERQRIAFILEDRDSVVRVWRDMGYRCLQVDSGDF